MNHFGMTEEEKKKILERHKDAVKKDGQKKEELKKGLQKPKEEKKN